MSAHHDHDIDWGAMLAHLELKAEMHAPALDAAADWMRGLLDADGRADSVDRVLDVGSGPGAITCLLARRFPGARVVAVDQSEPLLEHARSRAEEQGVGDRVDVLRADLPDDLDALGAADVVWSSQTVHHVGDQQAALDGLAAALRPAGLLAVVEGGLPARYLPRDIGVGRPGLQARLDAAWEDRFSTMRAELPGSVAQVEDWPAMLARAGLVPTGSRTFLVEHTAPLDARVREFLRLHLEHALDTFGDALDAGDRAAVERLADPDAPDGVLWRPDAFYLAAVTVHTARMCASDPGRGEAEAQRTTA
ncbi:class I SAM-dependent methyltransferase [Nocardiopsis sp. FIRDI 009]|uniref:class I SAM-dependent methyltransferase n=1 Tax=Nocardiopsis sp. FIRDI 009 TaxID=714197 RepID=UPI000E2282E3|nr:class I SAM-dependent methyltransferase [Nocardiopsis sp. FIRDI 009]